MSITLNTGTGGADLATDVVASEHYQRITLYTPLGDSAMDDTNDAVKVVNATAANLKVTEASAANMLTSLQLLDNAISGAGFNITQLNGAAVPIGAGTEAAALRVTLATDSTGLVSVDDNGSSLTVDNAGTFVVQEDGDALTALQLIDDIVLAEDTVHNSGDVGVMALAVREDAPAGLAADGDYHPITVGDKGGVWVEGTPNVVDSGNSTTSTLAGAAVFTGTGVDMLRCEVVTVLMDASHDSATDGLQFQFSSDDSNWDVTETFEYTASEGGRRFTLAAHGQYFRVVYTNGGTNQTHFRLQTILHQNATVQPTHRIVDDTHPDRSANLVKAAIIAQAAGSGDFVAIQATAAGNLKFSLQEISDGLDIGAGNAGSETQRVSISTDDVNLSAIKTAVEIIDNSIFVDDAAFTLTSSSVTIGGAIRDDALSALSAVEGDAIPLRVNSTGALHVTGAGGGTQYNVADAAGGTDTGTVSLVVRDDSLTTLTPADGDYTRLRVNSVGALHITGGGGGTEYTEDVATPNPIVGTATLMERDDVLSTLTPVAGDWVAFRSSAEGALWVQEFNSDAILADTANMDTNLGTLAGAVSGSEMQVDVLTMPTVTVDLGANNDIQGQTAHDAAISGNPVRIGATARNASATAVGNGDAVDLTADLEGKLVTSPHSVKEDYIDGVTAAVTNTSDTSIIAAQGADVRIYVTSVQVYNSHATVGTVTEIKDGTTVKHRGYAREDGGGYVVNFPVPIQCTADTALNGANVTTGANTYFNAQGYKAA